jgi:type IV secretion system protein VirB2
VKKYLVQKLSDNKNLIILGMTLSLMSGPALALGALPWEGIVTMIVSSLQGPVVRGGAVVAVIIFGLMLAFTEINGIFGTFAKVMFGLSFALMASSWVAMFVGF